MSDKEITWDQVEKNLNFTPEEEATIQIEMNKIQSTINARKLKKGGLLK